jgi:predicted nucleic acid-binding protein
MPGDKVFLDTNIIIYAYDTSAGSKREIASKILIDLWGSGLGVLSTQVLQEFYVNVTQKIRKPLTSRAAKEIISDFLKWELALNDGESILEAIDIQIEQRYSFWDAMILEAAVRSGCGTLLSEDFSDGQIIKGVKIKNPFMA